MNKVVHKGRQTSMKGWQEVKLRRQNGDSLFFLFKDRWGKANKAVKWEKKENKAGDVVGKVGRKMEGRQSLGKKMEGRGDSRVYSACLVSGRWRNRAEADVSWEGQAERALEVISDLSPLYKTGPFISKDSSPSERLSFPSREFHHTQPDPVLLMRELPIKEQAITAGGRDCWQALPSTVSGSQALWSLRIRGGSVCPRHLGSLSEEEPGALQSRGSQRAGQDWETNTLLLHFTSTEQAQEPPEEQSPSPPIGFPTRPSTHPVTQWKSNPPSVIMWSHHDHLHSPNVSYRS